MTAQSVLVAEVETVSRVEFTTQFRKEQVSPMKVECMTRELGF